MSRRSRALPVLLGLAFTATIHHSCQNFISSRPAQTTESSATRRQLLTGMGLASTASLSLAEPALAFERFTNQSGGFEFQYMLGLQKSNNKGYDIFLRDLIEPLEFVGVKVTPTNRESMDEIGTPDEVAKKLLVELVPAKAPKEIIKAESTTDPEGRRRDLIEFHYQWTFDEGLSRQLGRTKFQLHAKAMVTIKDNKQYLMLIGAEEDAWPRRSQDYGVSIDTFKLTQTSAF